MKHLILLTIAFLTGMVVQRAVAEEALPIRAAALQGGVSPASPHNPLDILVVLPNDGFYQPGTNSAPLSNVRYQRTGYLITPAEMAASGFPSGAVVTSLGFNIYAASVPEIAVTGLFKVYFENTSDATFTKSSTWTTLISTMTLAHDGTITIPDADGPYDVTLAGGSPFTYTGGGLYVAFEYQNAVDPLAVTPPGYLINSAGLTNGRRAATSNTSLPTTLSAGTFRAETRLGNSSVDVIQAPDVYALGKIAIPYGTPQTISVPILNVSAATPAIFDVTLTVKEAVSGTVRHTETIPGFFVAEDDTELVTFAPWSPTIRENDSIIVEATAIAGEQNLTNNRTVMVQSVDTNKFSYAQGTTSSGGVGFNSSTGDLAAKFSTGTPAVVDSIRVGFNSTGFPYRLRVWDATGPGGIPGASLYASPTYRSVGHDTTIQLNPAVSVSGVFYVGISQDTAANAGLFYQAETPLRPSVFYAQTPTSGGWGDMGNLFRLKFEATIGPGLPMTYASSSTTQNVVPVLPGATDQQIIGMQVVTTGNLLPLTATQIDCNTNGTANPATNISNARIYYTGSSSTFSPVNQFGVTVASPSGPIVVTGSQALVTGTNHFWLTYDINPGATVGDSVDAEFTSVTVGSAQTPGVTDPAGSRHIKTALAAGDYTVGLALFNRILGREVTFEKSVRKVVREVPVASDHGTLRKDDVRNTGPAVSPLSGMMTQQVEVEEEVWTLMDRGAPFAGRPRVEVTAADRARYGLGENVLAVYPTITAALVDLNNLGIAGPVQFLLVDATYPSETFPLTINAVPGASATNTITIRPQTSVTTSIAGSSASSIFKLDGSDYVTIDGSNSGGTDRSMTISNSNASTSSAVIWIASVASPRDSATNNTIKNCIVSGNSSTTTLIGIVISGSGLGDIADAQNIDNTIRNNATIKSQYGIAAVGPTDNETGLLVTQNTIGSATVGDKLGFNGIALFQQRNATVSNNTILGVVTATSSTASGIRVSGTADSIRIVANTISDIKNTNVVGWGSNGIQLNSSSPAAKVTVANNFIWDVASVGFADGTVLDNGYGIIAVTGGVYRIYHNSVNLNTNQTSLTGQPAAFNVTAGIPLNGMDVRNNIFANSQTTGTERYAIYSSAGDTAFASIDYNVYSTTGANLGFLGSTNRADLAAWRIATGQDLNSAFGVPLYTSPTNLHITSGSSPASNTGSTLASVADDFDGDLRGGSPDIGADEFTPFSIGVNLNTGWNLISNPVITASDSVKQLYPTSLFTYAFSFGASGYTQAYRMVNGAGHWGKFPATAVQPIAGGTNTLDTVPVVGGWNLLGSLSSIIDTAQVNYPPGLLTTVWFGYNPPPVLPTGYYTATQIIPGSAYWVKASGAGNVIFSTAPAPAAKSGVAGENPLATLSSIIITDRNGVSQQLYFGSDRHAVNTARYAMPPMPPAGAFDARFETADGGAMVQTHASGAAVSLPVVLQSDGPITVSWTIADGAVYELSNAAGGQAKVMQGSGSATFTNTGKLIVKSTGLDGMPAEYALYQNYPNPFNPSTSIRFALPVQSRVTAEIYNTLGQRVKVLVNDQLPAGYHIVEWNGTGSSDQTLGSGVYFIRLSATGNEGRSFSDVRKLMLLK